MTLKPTLARLIKRCAPVALTLPMMAWAHTGDGGLHTHAPFFAGLLHPLAGADHLAAMIAVGAWSALALKRVWLAPAAFVTTFAAGAITGMVSTTGGLWSGQVVEPMIAASLLILGLLVATRRSLPLGVALAMSGCFAFFHGLAHGQELAGLDGSGSAAALSGMVLATVALHGLGIALGARALATRQRLTAVVGAGIALLGSGLMLGLV